MQHAQQNYLRTRTAILAALLAMAAGTAWAAGIANRSAPDPLLDGPVQGPCDPKLAQPDYVGGTDVYGKPVEQADLPHAKVPVPGEILVPLPNRTGGMARGQSNAGPLVAVNGKALDPTLNPAPACPEPKAR